LKAFVSRHRSIRNLGFGGLIAAALLPLSAGAQEIGTVALAVANVTGTPMNAAARNLTEGTRITLDETVTTAAGARAEFLFLDQTSLSMGENTSIVLDRFVFDPNTGSGEMALSMTRGVLRMIGGKVSDNQPALVVTPTATIGIRGSSALITTDGTQSQVIFVAGDELCLTPVNSRVPVCTSVIGGMLTEQGFVGQVDSATLINVQSAINNVAAGNGAGTSVTDVTGLDLTQVVPLDVIPFTTGGNRNTTTPDGQTQLQGFGQLDDPVSGLVQTTPTTNTTNTSDQTTTVAEATDPDTGTNNDPQQQPGGLPGGLPGLPVNCQLNPREC
jgi:hypothetical protein